MTQLWHFHLLSLRLHYTHPACGLIKAVLSVWVLDIKDIWRVVDQSTPSDLAGLFVDVRFVHVQSRWKVNGGELTECSANMAVWKQAVLSKELFKGNVARSDLISLSDP